MDNHDFARLLAEDCVDRNTGGFSAARTLRLAGAPDWTWDRAKLVGACDGCLAFDVPDYGDGRLFVFKAVGSPSLAYGRRAPVGAELSDDCDAALSRILADGGDGITEYEVADNPDPLYISRADRFASHHMGYGGPMVTCGDRPVIVVARRGGRTAGVLIGRRGNHGGVLPDNWTAPYADAAVIMRLAVDPSFRGRGIGGALLSRFYAEVPQDDLVLVAVNAAGDGDGFYAHRGFKTVRADDGADGVRFTLAAPMPGRKAEAGFIRLHAAYRHVDSAGNDVAAVTRAVRSFRNIRVRSPVYPVLSMSAGDIIGGRDPSFLDHDARVAEVPDPAIGRVYASTLEFWVDSVKIAENGLTYSVFVMFSDLWPDVGRSDFRDVLESHLKAGDVFVACNCPAAQYWGYNYIGTQLAYQYPGYEEGRYPDVRNPDLRGTVCKHADRVLRWMLDPANFGDVYAAIRHYYHANRQAIEGGAPVTAEGAPIYSVRNLDMAPPPVEVDEDTGMARPVPDESWEAGRGLLARAQAMIDAAAGTDASDGDGADGTDTNAPEGPVSSPMTPAQESAMRDAARHLMDGGGQDAFGESPVDVGVSYGGEEGWM